MYFFWISFISGACACSDCIEWICRTVSGTRQIRTRIVTATIDHAHGSPTVVWKKSRIDFITFSSGDRIERSTTSITGSRLRRATTGCSAAAASRPAATPLTTPCLRIASAAYSEQVGWNLQVFAGSERRDEQLVEADREDRDASGCDRAHAARLAEHLVDALGEPVEAVRLDRLGQALAHDQHVVVRRRHALERCPNDLAQLALDAVADDGVPDRLRNGEAKPRLADRLLAREPVSVRKRVETDRPCR